MKRKLRKYIRGFETAWSNRTQSNSMFEPFITTVEKDNYIEIQMWLPTDDMKASLV